MKTLSSEMKVGETKEVTLKHEGNPGYTIVVGYGEVIISEPIDFEDYVDEDLSGYEMVILELPENDFRKFDGSNYVAMYGVLPVNVIPAEIGYEDPLEVNIERVR